MGSIDYNIGWVVHRLVRIHRTCQRRRVGWCRCWLLSCKDACIPLLTILCLLGRSSWGGVGGSQWWRYFLFWTTLRGSRCSQSTRAVSVQGLRWGRWLTVRWGWQRYLLILRATGREWWLTTTSWGYWRRILRISRRLCRCWRDWSLVGGM